MSNIRSRMQLYCPSCAYSLSELEEQRRQCKQCGHILDLEDLKSKHRDKIRNDAANMRAIFAEWLTGALGLLGIISGLILICLSEVGPPQLLSRFGISISVLTFVAIAHRKVNDEPMQPVLFVFGLVWLAAGLYCWGLF